MQEIVYTTIASPIGELALAGDRDGALRFVSMLDAPRAHPVASSWIRDAAPLADAARQLTEYFAGDRTTFELELRPSGSSFQLRVWHALTEIPYGATESYGQLARRIGHPDGARAVGLANGQNPIAVIVPCHRVIGASGALTGYGGGLERKRRLLDLESGVLELPAA